MNRHMPTAPAPALSHRHGRRRGHWTASSASSWRGTPGLLARDAGARRATAASALAASPAPEAAVARAPGDDASHPPGSTPTGMSVAPAAEPDPTLAQDWIALSMTTWLGSTHGLAG